MPEPRFRNIDYTDRELLAEIWAAGGDVGVNTAEIATRLGISTNGKNKTPSMKIGSRLSWMRRFGFLESRVDKGENIWAVTQAGQMLMKGNLSKAIATALEKMDPGSQLLLMRSLSRQAYVEGSNETAVAIRREWQHQAAQRR